MDEVEEADEVDEVEEAEGVEEAQEAKEMKEAGRICGCCCVTGERIDRGLLGPLVHGRDPGYS